MIQRHHFITLIVFFTLHRLTQATPPLKQYTTCPAHLSTLRRHADLTLCNELLQPSKRLPLSSSEKQSTPWIYTELQSLRAHHATTANTKHISTTPTTNNHHTLDTAPNIKRYIAILNYDPTKHSSKYQLLFPPTHTKPIQYPPTQNSIQRSPHKDPTHSELTQTHKLRKERTECCHLLTITRSHTGTDRQMSTSQINSSAIPNSTRKPTHPTTTDHMTTQPRKPPQLTRIQHTTKTQKIAGHKYSRVYNLTPLPFQKSRPTYNTSITHTTHKTKRITEHRANPKARQQPANTNSTNTPTTPPTPTQKTYHSTETR